MTNEHWTDDPELVELFVSGAMGPEQKEGCESHLSRCAACSSIVNREAVLREGIRIYGRNSLKSRLRKRLAHSSPTAVPWPHIMSAAALLVIIVGIGIQTSVWKNAELTLQDARVGQVDSVGAGEFSAVHPGPPPVREPAPAESAVEDRSAEFDDLESAASLRRERALSVTSPAAGLAKSKVDRMEGVVWVTGKILADSPRTAFRDEKKISAAEVEMESLQMQSKDFAGPRIKASQRPLRMLPPDQQQAVQSRQVGRVGLTGLQEVMTALEEKDDSLHMTIFTDDVEIQSQSLQIMPVTDDSVIVTAGKARIALKLPASMKAKVH